MTCLRGMVDLHRPAGRGPAAARRSSFKSSRIPAVVIAAWLLPACGSTPGGPGGTPTPTPTPAPAGPVAGRYLLQITPAAGCGAPIPTFSFPMEAAVGGSAPKAGTQVVLTGDPGALEAEFLSESQTLRGGVGTTADGAVANESLRLWVRVIGAGPVTRATDGRGEVRTGTMMGYLAFAGASGDEGDLGSCSAANHTFTLGAR
jgi:hypothetical protein